MNQQLLNVVESLDKVSGETKQMIYDMANSMNELEIIHSFNQQAHDLFTMMYNITKKIGQEKKYNVVGYKTIFENALKINAKLPIDKFTLLILEFASDIYEENEDCFLNMSLEDTKINVGNEFSIIRSEMFKNLWAVLDQANKNLLKEKIILLTTYAHAYLYKIILGQK